MRQLGLSLEQVAILLAGRDRRAPGHRPAARARGPADPDGAAAPQAAHGGQGRRDADDAGFAEIIRLTGDLTGYLRPEKIDAMRRRMGELGVVAEHAVGVEMPRLYGEALEEMRSGTPPSDPAVRRIVDRLDELSELIRGPDTEIGTAVRALWVDRGRQHRPVTTALTGATWSPTWTRPAPPADRPPHPPRLAARPVWAARKQKE